MKKLLILSAILLLGFTTFLHISVLADELIPTETPIVTPTATPDPNVPIATNTPVVTPPPAQLGIYPICLTNTYCDKDQVTCAQTSDPAPIYHRMKAEGAGITVPAGKTLFFEECIKDPNLSGTKYCVPLPLEKNGETYTVPVGTASWEGDNELFVNALVQRCVQGYVDINSANTACTSEKITQTTEFKALDAALKDLKYKFLGLFTANGNTLIRVVAQPVAIPVGGFEWGSESGLGMDRERGVEAIYFTAFGGTTSQGQEESPHTSELGMPNTAASCKGVSYDPYGKVFHSGSLRPVGGAKVWLFSETKNLGVPVLDANGYQMYSKYVSDDPTFLNPSISNTFGSFSFRVPEGNYKILLTNAQVDIQGLTFSLDPATYASTLAAQSALDLSTAYQSGTAVVVQNNVNVTLFSSIYEANNADPAPVIIQGNVPIHKNLSSILAPAETEIAEYERIVSPAGHIILNGQTTAPYAKVLALSTNNREIKNTFSDKDGNFMIIINPVTELETGEDFRNLGVENPVYQKFVSLLPETVRNNTLVFLDQVMGRVIKAAQAVKYTPAVAKRLSHLEGFAYDKSGNILPYAEVAIMETTRFTVSYRTITDANGYFVVRSANLPSGMYQIMYKAKGGSEFINISASDFENRNRLYAVSEKIEFSKPTLSGRAEAFIIANPTLYPELKVQTKEPEIREYEAVDTATNPTVPNSDALTRSVTGAQNNNAVNAPSTMILVYIVILLILVVGAGMLIVYYLKRKQDPHLYDQQV